MELFSIRIQRTFQLVSTPDTEYPEVFPAERRQQEEIYHLFLVLREFAFRRINVQNLFLSVCNGFLDGYFLVTFVLLFQFFHRESCFR